MTSITKKEQRAESGAAALRFESDKRQLAALLMITGFCALIQPMAGVATAIGRDGTTADSGVPLSQFIGGLTLVTLGIASILTGYMQLVHDWGNKKWTLFWIVFTQATYIPYISDMTAVGRAARNAMGFIPAVYNPTDSDFRLVGAMGIMAILGYGFALVGSVAFMLFSLHKYQSNQPHLRNGDYYRGRMTFYCAMLFLAGLSQLILGSFVAARFGAKAMPEGPVAVAMYIVNFPVMSIFVGGIQLLNAVWGIARSRGMVATHDFSYQLAILAGWVTQLVFQIAQVGYDVGAMRSQALAGTVAVAFSLNMMPAFLDYKARTVPKVITPEYYDVNEDDAARMSSSSEDEHEQVQEEEV